MTSQIILTGALFAIFLYAIAQRPKLFTFRAAVTAICLTGTLVVWMPELSTKVANSMNIGRGADLITYLWIALSLLMTVNLHVRIKLESERLTVLAREIALLTSQACQTKTNEPGSQ